VGTSSRAITGPAAGGSAEMRFSAYGMVAMSKVPLSVLCGDSEEYEIAVLSGCALGRQGPRMFFTKDEFEFLLPASGRSRGGAGFSRT
jgi:hypothetical protein